MFEENLPGASVRRDLRMMYHKSRVQAQKHKVESWQVGRELFVADQLIESAANNLWGGAFTLLSLTITMIGFVVATFFTISNDDKLVWQLIVAALLMKLTPWPAFLLHRAQLLRTTAACMRSQEDVMGLMCVDFAKEALVTDTEEACKEKQSLFARVAHVHFLYHFQQFMTTITAAQCQDMLALVVQCGMILVLIGHENHSNSAANITYAVTSLQSMRILSGHKMTFLINLSAGYQVSSPH